MNGWAIEPDQSAQRELRLLEDGPRPAAIDLLEYLRELGPTLVLAIQLRVHKDDRRARFFTMIVIA
jgi:hypothetical protein